MNLIFKRQTYKFEFMRYLFLLLLVNLSIGNAQQEINNASVNFKIKNIGVNVNGKFTQHTISTRFIKNDLESSYINAIVKINSIDTGIKKRDAHLLKADYFDAENYPSMKFASTKIERTSENEYKITGKLTIKNTTRNVQLPLILNQKGVANSASTKFVLRRKDYGVGGKSWVMSDKVNVQVSFFINE